MAFHDDEDEDLGGANDTEESLGGTLEEEDEDEDELDLGGAEEEKDWA